MKRLSIIIPYYHGKDFIKNTIDEILKSHDKTNKQTSFDILVMIDSMDDANEIERELMETYIDKPVQCHRNPQNLGVAKTRNYGLSKTKSDFVTFIDQDDLVESNYFEVIEKALSSKHDVYILNGYNYYVDTDNKEVVFKKTPNFILEEVLSKKTNIPTPGLVIFKRKILPERLFIDPSKYKGCDDWAAYLNILLSVSNVRSKFINQKVFNYIIHGNNYRIENELPMRYSSLATLNYFLEESKESKHKMLLENAILIKRFDIRRKGHNIPIMNLALKYPKSLLLYIGNYIERHLLP